MIIWIYEKAYYRYQTEYFYSYDELFRKSKSVFENKRYLTKSVIKKFYSSHPFFFFNDFTVIFW